MRLAIGRPRTALIVAPHPDDEMIGACGLIRALVRRGTIVRTIVVTNGAASHPGSRAWPRPRLIAARRAESRRALRRLGIAASHVRFLGLEDGACGVERCGRALADAVRKVRRLDLIVGPAPDDAHLDHRAVAAALRAARAPARRLAYRVWPPSPVRRGRLLTLPVGAAAKRSVLRLYRTQLGAITDDPRGFAIARHELEMFARPLETFVALR